MGLYYRLRRSEVPTQDMLFPNTRFIFLTKTAIEMFITMYLTYKKIPIGQHVQQHNKN